MKAYEKLNLFDYMGRENYLSRFNNSDEILDELNYIKYRLNQKIDLLTRAVLELKQIDLEKKLAVVQIEMRNRQEQEQEKLEKQRMKSYKESLIQDILERSNNHSLEDLQKMTVKSLKRIFDYV